jgi:hypothetical protein
MKTRITLAFALFLTAATAFGQAPNFRISFDANLAGAACQPLGATKMYAHSGAGTSGETALFEVVVGNWAMDDGVGQMTSTGTDTWEIEFNLYDYYGLVEGTDVIYGIGVVFRNEDGTLEGKDDNCADIAIRGIETGPISVQNTDGTPFAGVTAGFITGINEAPVGVSNISISPNPAVDAAVFTFNTVVNSNYDLIITNAMGQQVATQRIVGEQAIIERAGLPAGLYFATLVDERGARATQRFLFN